MSNEHQQPHRLSHELDDFAASAMYMGGTNTILDARYVTWDYNGTQPPDSNTALMLKCLPTDGSNDNKEHIEYWNVGSSADYVPDENGQFLIGQKQMHQSCNLFQLLKSLRDNCGLERGKLSQDGIGVHALIGSDITFVRTEVKREGFRDSAPDITAGGGPKPQQRVQTALTATKAKFSWEKTGKGKGDAKGAATATTPATATAPAPASSNGAGGPDNAPLIAAISAVLADNDNAVELSNLSKLVTEKLSVVQGMTAGRRLTLMKSIKGPAQLAELAAANGWVVDEAEGVLLVG